MGEVIPGKRSRMEKVRTFYRRKDGIKIERTEQYCEMCSRQSRQDSKKITIPFTKGLDVQMILCKCCRISLVTELIGEIADRQVDKKTLREQRTKMSKDELIRAVWLLDEYVEAFGWHSTDLLNGGELPSKYTTKHGYWCKMRDGSYKHLQFDNRGFYENMASRKIYFPKGSVVAWQGLHEVAVY